MAGGAKEEEVVTLLNFWAGGAKEEEVVTLLNFWASPFAMRVVFALKLKGVKYESIEQSMVEKSQCLIEANPIYKKVPVLIHNGKPICESSIIVQYIDETWPGEENNLLPKHPLARAYARFWADYIDKKVFDAGPRIMRTSGEQQQQAREEFIGYLKVIEGELRDNYPFFGGKSMDFVDVVLAPLVPWLSVFDKLSGGSLLNLVQTKFPRLHKFMDAVKKGALEDLLVDSDKILEYCKGLRKRYGVE